MSGDGDTENSYTVLVQRAPDAWSRIYCKSLWLLIPVVGVVSAMRLGAPGRLSALAQTLGMQPFTAFLVAFFLLLFFLATSFFLCLHGRVTRGDKEKVLVSDEGLQKTAASPWLSLVTDLDVMISQGTGGRSGLPRWHARRDEIRRLAVHAGRTLGQTTLNVHLKSGGQIWLEPIEAWVPAHHHHGNDGVGRRMPKPRGPATVQTLRSLPLVQALLAHHYHVEFVRVGFLGTKYIGSE